MSINQMSPINLMRRAIKSAAKKIGLTCELITFSGKQESNYGGLNLEGNVCSCLLREKGFRSLFAEAKEKEIMLIGDGIHKPLGVVPLETILELLELRKSKTKLKKRK